jgi:hypothetical protein
MALKPANGIMARQGRKALVLSCLAGLAACAATDAAHPPMFMSVDGVPMKVYYAEDVLDFVEITDKDPVTGEEIRITPHPLTSGYVAIRNDGKPTTEGDKDRARQAAAHFCTSSGKAPGELRFNSLQNNGAARVWYFGGCA